METLPVSDPKLLSDDEFFRLDPTRLLLPRSFFILEVGVLVRGGDMGATDGLESARVVVSSEHLDDTGVELVMKLSVVFRRENIGTSRSNFSFLGVSDSGVLERLEADLRAVIQLFLIP